jgi:hypothetical protein
VSRNVGFGLTGRSRSPASLNEQASVGFAFTQQIRGRKVGHKCLAKTPKSAKRKGCTRTLTAGTLSFSGHAGANTVGFQGRISPSKRLAPGGDTLTITATNSAGARSAPASLRFTIVRWCVVCGLTLPGWQVVADRVWRESAWPRSGCSRRGAPGSGRLASAAGSERRYAPLDPRSAALTACLRVR